MQKILNKLKPFQNHIGHRDDYYFFVGDKYHELFGNLSEYLVNDIINENTITLFKILEIE